MIAPKLRFVEFNDEWQMCNLPEVTIDEKKGIKIGPFGSQLKKEYLSEVGQYKVYGQENVFADDFSIGNRYISEDKFKELQSSELSENDIVISMMGTIGKIAVIPSNIKAGIMDSHLIRIRLNQNKYDNNFFIQVMKTNGIKKQIQSQSVGSIMSGLSSSIIRKLIIPFPSFQEQSKIANFLILIDIKIQKQKEKVEILKVQKKGLMQKIFSHELRFKDENGQEYPKWEIVKIKDISESISYGMNAASKVFDGENIYLRITDIDDGSRKYIEKGKVSPNGLLEEKYKLKNNDILFARTGASTGKSFFFEDEERSFYFAGFLIRVRLNQTVDAKFVYQNTNTSAYRKWVKIMSMRSGQPGINGEEYGQFSLKLPCLEEQQKIAKLLSTIDKKTQLESNKISQLRKLKQGFMHQMFI